ncbi:MAG: NUDIX hydrolase [Clostridia bacterium]|nr:NUDIX hydrolase [Clostridia bacterium]
MELFEKTLTQDYKYRGKIVNLRVDTAELPDGQECLREVIEHNGGVTVCAVNENKEIFLVKQFRYPYSEVVTETPAGKLEKGEDPAAAGIRELEEEAGVTAENFVFLGKFYPSPGYCGEIIYLYAASGLKKTQQNLDEDEFLNVETISLDSAVSKVLSGEIPDGKTQAVILRTAMMIEKGEFQF